MSPLLMALVGVLLLPLFVSTWRTSLLGLSAQGVLLAWVAYRLYPHLSSVNDVFTMFDLLVVRAIVAPLLLYRVLVAQKSPIRNDVIPPNLLSWTLVLGLVMMSFRFSRFLLPQGGDEQTLVTVSVCAILLGFLVLSTQAGPFSQIVGALRIENGIALFELGGARHHEAPAIRLGLVLAFLITVLLFRWYLRQLNKTTLAAARAATAPASAAATEQATL